MIELGQKQAQVTPAFLNALAKTLGYEGEVSSHPADPGGLTKWGITQRTYDAYRLTKGKARRSVLDLEDDEMRAIYYESYWTPCNCEALPMPLAAAVFDMAVHSGTWNAKLTLQRSLRIRADGVVGPVTIAAAKASPSPLPFLRARGAYIQEVINARPGSVVFLEGWINRLLDQAWAGAK